MKKIIFVVAALLVGTFALTSCGSSSPKASAEKYLTAFYRMEYDEAKKYATEETKGQLDMMKQIFTMMGNDTVKQQAKRAVVNVTDVKEEGNTAVVTYTVKPDGKEQAPGAQTLKMIKEKGKWLASWNKQEPGTSLGEPDHGTDPNAMPMDPNAPAAPLPADTGMTPTR